MATFTVTTNLDTTAPEAGETTLREAVALANAATGADEITFAAGVEGTEVLLTQGQIGIFDDLAIDGNDVAGGLDTGIDADQASRIFEIAGDGTSVVLDDLALSNGLSTNFGGAIFLNDGELALTGSSVVDSTASSSGGAVYANADATSLTIDASELRGNAAQSTGGAVWSELDTTITRSTFAGNTAASRGGAFDVTGGQLTVGLSTIVDNEVTDASGQGGGVFSQGSAVTIADGTVAGNSAGGGGGGIAASNLRLSDSIVAGNAASSGNPADVSGTLAQSNGHNIFGSTVAGAADGDRQSVAATALLAYAGGEPVLAANGGATPTVALLDDTGNLALRGAARAAAGATDQRGGARPNPIGTNPDVGAFEQAAEDVTTTPTAPATTTSSAPSPPTRSTASTATT